MLESKEHQDPNTNQDSDLNNGVNNAMTQALEELKRSNQALLAELDSMKKEKAEQEKLAQEKAKAEADKKRAEKLDLDKLFSEQDEEDLPRKGNRKDIESLTNSELLDLVGNVVDQYVTARSDTLKEELQQSSSGMAEQLKKTNIALSQLLVRQTVADARAKHPDLDQYMEGIVKLMDDTPGLTLEKAYVLAKAMNMQKEPPHPGQATERESSPIGQHSPLAEMRKRSSSSRDIRSNRPTRDSSALFKDILSNAFDRVHTDY